jgi:hypothetical protein
MYIMYRQFKHWLLTLFFGLGPFFILTLTIFDMLMYVAIGTSVYSNIKEKN